MGVDDLAGQRFPDPNVAREASILPVGSRVDEMLVETPVAADAEVSLLHWAETEAMVVVVARCAQATAHVPGRRITDKTSGLGGRGGESVLAQRRPRGPVAVQGALESAREVLAGQRLLELGLVAAPTLAVAHRFREVGMATWRVALPTTDAPGRVATLGVVCGGGRRVAGHTVFDVGDGPRHCLRIRPRRSRHQEAASGPKPKEGNEEASGEPHQAAALVHRPASATAIPDVDFSTATTIFRVRSLTILRDSHHMHDDTPWVLDLGPTSSFVGPVTDTVFVNPSIDLGAARRFRDH